jgi:polar amino acid transport system substrate-binding protein
MPAGSYMETILKNGHLSVGVDENTLGLAYRNPETGNIEGFEVKLAVEIARHIFADNDPEAHVDEVPVLTDEKVSAVREATVDLTIDAITMSCDRWQLVDFSTEYYTADQQFLVRSGSPIKTESDLVGRRVCVTSDSSSEKIMTKRVPNAELVPVASRTECLVALQEGEVDAYFGHDSFLYGMTEQDRTLKVMPLLPQAETLSHYGIAVNKEHPEFVRFVNAVLDELRQDGTWSDFHEQLVDDLPDLPPADPPKPRYRD